MAETLKEKTAKGLFWGGLSNGIQQAIGLIVGVFLARMLTQSDYGMVGMLTIFSALAGALQEGGFISALNRKKEVSDEDYNAVFWTSSLISLFFYFVLFLCAPLIAGFYGVPELKSLARYVFVGFFITSLGIAPRAYMFRNMMVRENAIVSISCVLFSGIVGLAMAACGFTYWGLATQTIVWAATITIMSFCYSKWRPTLSINFAPIKDMIGFSSKLIVTNIFYIINNNIFSVLLGRMYSSHEVGNYTQANKWNYMGWSFINNMLNGIAQPVFVKTDDDSERQKRVFRKLIRFTAFVSFPAMFGLALVAKEFIVILLTEKWLESALLMQMLCVLGAFIPITSLFSNLIISRGHSNIYMWCTIALCLIQLASAVAVAPYGINRMIQVYVAVGILWLFVWHHYAAKEMDLDVMEVLKDISPYLLLSVTLVLIASSFSSYIGNLLLCMIAKIVFVAVVYVIVLWLFNSTILKEAIIFVTKRKIE